jgi:hypothetical protein
VLGEGEEEGKKKKKKKKKKKELVVNIVDQPFYRQTGIAK